MTFLERIAQLSTPGKDFPDSFMSNEDFSLVIPQLSSMGGVYIGVGAEQNFSYIAALRPELAFIVDCRRKNLLQHLLYKALFLRNAAPDEFLLEMFSGSAWSRIAEALPQGLSASDLATIQEIHALFVSKGPVGLTYASCREYSVTTYPAYAQMMGLPGSFLGTDAAYQAVRALHQADKILPLVGNFYGEAALAPLAASLNAQGLAVTAAYLTNLLRFARFPRFQNLLDNLMALPWRSDGILLKASVEIPKSGPVKTAIAAEGKEEFFQMAVLIESKQRRIFEMSGRQL